MLYALCGENLDFNPSISSSSSSAGPCGRTI